MKNKGQISLFYLIIFLMVVMLFIVFYNSVEKIQERVDVYYDLQEQSGIKIYDEVEEMIFSDTPVFKEVFSVDKNS